MRFHMILLMTLPPGNDDDITADSDYTQPAPPAMPDATGLTRPMPSPYLGATGAPPPPPATGPTPMWRAAGAPVAQRAASRPTGLLVVAGVLVAVAIIAFAGAALALIQHGNGTPGNTSAAKIVATNTPMPTATKSPTATPTVAPTNTPGDGNSRIPLPPDGFQQYIEPGNLWGLNIPNNTTPMPSGPSTDGLYQQQVQISLAPSMTQFNVFDLAQPVQDGQFTAFWSQLLQDANIPPLEQPTYAGTHSYHKISWQVWQSEATPGQISQVMLLYHKHDGVATAIVIITASDNFATGDMPQTLDEMLNSFTYLS
jgi:hypothetical protein